MTPQILAPQHGHGMPRPRSYQVNARPRFHLIGESLVSNKKIALRLFMPFLSSLEPPSSQT